MFRPAGIEPSALLLVFCVCAVFVNQVTNPILAQSDQPSIMPAQDLKPAQLKTQAPKSDEPKAKKDNGEEGTEREKEGAGKKAVSSLILTVKLVLLEDPRLFPYEIEVEAGSDGIVLSGKVSTEAEKSMATEIARTVPGVKSVANKIEILKELPEVLARKQDDIITHQVKERFAKSTTLKAAGFEVKTEWGVVSLGGTVRFQVIVLEAAEAARQVPGVKAVKTAKVRIESEG
jgi:hyperosmotically inducible protein